LTPTSTIGAGVPVPDGHSVLLPARAFLLSLREQSLELRRTALQDAETHFASVASGHQHEVQLAVVSVIGEALQIVEDVAALGSALIESPTGFAFFVSATRYSAQSVNNFYSSFKNRPDSDLLKLLAVRVEDVGLEDASVFVPPLSDEERAAVAAADSATAKLVREHLVRLANDWETYRRFFHAFKHGLLVINPEHGFFIDDRETPVNGIVVWHRGKNGHGYGHIRAPYANIVAYLGDLGRLAIDLLDHLIDSRLRFFELLDLQPDGSITPLRLAPPPWRWWFHDADLDRRSRTLLTARFGVQFG
jgi:hypothetical protein